MLSFISPSSQGFARRSRDFNIGPSNPHRKAIEVNIPSKPKAPAKKAAPAIFKPPRDISPALPRKPAVKAVSALGRLEAAKKALQASQLKIDAILVEAAEHRALGFLTKSDFDVVYERAVQLHVAAAKSFGAIK